MQIKALWGFKGDPAAVGNEDGRVLTGTVLTVDDKYGHHLIGANLAEPYGDEDEAAYQARVAASSADPDALAAAHADLAEREGRHADAIKAFEDRAKELDDLQADIADRESALAAREAAVERREAEVTQAADDAANKAGESDASAGKAPKEAKPATPKETK